LGTGIGRDDLARETALVICFTARLGFRLGIVLLISDFNQIASSNLLISPTMNK
jgi:hypothetical protein